MADNYINTLKQLYFNAAVPVVIAGEDGSILWRNPPADMAPDVPADSIIQDSGKSSSGLICKTSGDTVFCFTVLKAEDPTEKKIYYIIETVETRKPKSLADDPDVKNFVNYLCSKIRIALGDITSTADDIFDAVSIGDINGEKITDGLNKIDRSIMSVAKEVVQPEQFYAMLDGDGRTAVLSMSDELKSITGEIKENFGSSVTVTGECPPNIYFRMNRSVFRAIIAEMTAECCSSELYPDLIVYAVKRTEGNRAELTVRSINTSGNSNTAYDLSPREADIRGINRHVFFDQMCRALEEKYGVFFSHAVQQDGILYKMDIEVFPKGSSPIAMRSPEYSPEDEQRFGPISLALADFYHKERYYYIDHSRIDDYNEKNEE